MTTQSYERTADAAQGPDPDPNEKSDGDTLSAIQADMYALRTTMDGRDAESIRRSVIHLADRLDAMVGSVEIHAQKATRVGHTRRSVNVAPLTVAVGDRVELRLAGSHLVLRVEPNKWGGFRIHLNSPICVVPTDVRTMDVLHRQLPLGGQS